MLYLTCQVGETIIIGEVTIKVERIRTGIDGGLKAANLGIKAPRHIPIQHHRNDGREFTPNVKTPHQ